MEVTVFSDSSAIKTGFSKIEKSKSFSVKYQSIADIKKNAGAVPPDSVIYADMTGLEQAALKKNLAMLAASERVFGIIDTKDSSGDPAMFFHSGASDYIGKVLFKDGLDPARLKRVYEYGKGSLPEVKTEAKPAVKFTRPLSGRDWKGVTSGKEYTFCFMHVELDDQREIKKRFSGKALEDFTKKFHDYVERSVSDINGKIWMWADLGGLVILPFDGENCPAIFKGFNMMLNRRIASFEDFDFDMLLSYRISIHIGDTAYQLRGDTGNIVSDSVNSIHHLKQNFAKAGNMYITEDAWRFIPAGFEKFFVKAGTYEGREIYRLLELL